MEAKPKYEDVEKSIRELKSRFDDGLISPEGQNDQLAARLWDRSRELVGA